MSGNWYEANTHVQLTGALSHVLPIMISVMVSKWVADAMGKEGIYALWIAMRQYPWLPSGEYRDSGQTAAQIVKSVENLVIIQDEKEPTLKELREFFSDGKYRGYPVVRGEKLLGYVDQDKALAYIGKVYSCAS